MSASSEKLGLKLLGALKREKHPGKSLLDCRPISAIAAELRFSQAQLDEAIAFLVEKRAINAAQRKDGNAILPSPNGEALLAEKHEKKAWTLDRRLVLYGIIAALISSAVGVLAWLSMR